jgi:hypothetical protein
MSDSIRTQDDASKEHWHGDDGRTRYVRIQGSLFQTRTLKPLRPDRPPATRGFVLDFSRQSRIRVFQMVATVDWTDVGRSSFITLTYPDAFVPFTTKKISQHRAVFWRYIEKHLGNKRPAFWRIEWKIRKSGARTGQDMPHLHIVALNFPWIDKRDISEFWGKALRWTGYVDVRIEEITNAVQCARYVCKYVGKELHCSLGILTKRNNPGGRQWGILRKKLMPFAREVILRLPKTLQFATIVQRAREVLHRDIISDDDGFFLLGGQGISMQNLFHSLGMDADEWIE